MRAMMDEPASEMLLNASAMIATEPAKIPKVNFPMNKRTLTKIPVKPASEAYLPRTAGLVGSWALPTNSRIRKFVIQYLFARKYICICMRDTFLLYGKGEGFVNVLW